MHDGLSCFMSRIHRGNIFLFGSVYDFISFKVTILIQYVNICSATLVSALCRMIRFYIYVERCVNPSIFLFQSKFRLKIVHQFPCHDGWFAINWVQGKRRWGLGVGLYWNKMIDIAIFSWLHSKWGQFRRSSCCWPKGMRSLLHQGDQLPLLY
jgi:hypothetical protein